MTESTTDQQQPHVPSERCLDTCDNPYVCADEYNAWKEQKQQPQARTRGDYEADYWREAFDGMVQRNNQLNATVARQAEQIERLSEAIKHIGFSNSAIPGAPELAIVGVRLIKDALAALEADQ